MVKLYIVVKSIYILYVIEKRLHFITMTGRHCPSPSPQLHDEAQNAHSCRSDHLGGSPYPEQQKSILSRLVLSQLFRILTFMELLKLYLSQRINVTQKPIAVPFLISSYSTFNNSFVFFRLSFSKRIHQPLKERDVLPTIINHQIKFDLPNPRKFLQQRQPVKSVPEIQKQCGYRKLSQSCSGSK
jgi:hypothetical protein